ncbi:MAG: class I SAM-dependent DNA methyltransferase [Nanopusillaceae archaeon]
MIGKVPVPQIDIDDVVNCIKQSVRMARNEEEVRARVSVRCIEEKILKPLGITQYGRYEYTLVSGARVDALYGHVIVEYKAPGKLSSASDIAKAKEQVIRYITKEAPSKAEWDRYLGVIISDRIAFVRYYKPQDTWILRGPYDITRESIVKLIEAIRGLRRKALKVDPLLNDFGPQSIIARRAVNTLYRKLLNSKNPRTRMLFEDWMRLFKQATGYDPEKLKELRQLASEYDIVDSVNCDALIFAIQTYYAFIMKLLAAEVVYLYGGGRFYKSYIAELDDRYTSGGVEALRGALAELESGGIFKTFGYENFIEGDYFSWYLGELDKELADVLAEIVRRLEDYEPATPQLEPEYARDLLKRLYQNIVPRDIRHKLGEYYTPDWLADFLLDEAGLALKNLEEMGTEDSLKPLQIRVLDPACGSGTFLVRYIARLRAYAREHYLEDILVDYLLSNVVGYDLNPIAVLTARTNYLLMIADLPKRETIEIPVYLADSLMVERKTTLTGNVYVLKTVVGEFQVPVRIVDSGLLPEILSEVTSALKNRYTPDDFKNRIKHVFKDISNSELDVLTRFYATLLKLEVEGKNDVWVSIIRNAFAPMLKGKFDYVVGNPPWVNWENLPEEYREISKLLWSQYGLMEARGRGLGKVKRDLAMLFLARCFDLYLKPSGKHAFLMPFTVFKTQAGAGFRRFLATKTKIHVVHDLVTTYPFEGAINRTSAIVVEKICELRDIGDSKKCPDSAKLVEENKTIKHVVWVSEKPVPTDTLLEEVLRTVERYQAVMTSIVEKDPSSPWMQVTKKVLTYVRKLIGKSPYEAHEGVLPALNQVYYVKIKEKLPDGKLVITNPPEAGQKKRIKQVEAVVEPDYVYPLIRGRDIKRWYVDFRDRYIIVPHDPKTGKPLQELVVKTEYPHTYQYFSIFSKELMNRSIHKLWGKGNPFYAVYDIGSYTFAPYKVVWKRIAGAITGKAVSFECAVAVPMPIKLPNGEVVSGLKPTVPDDSTILLGFDELDEAYYVCGVLNSSIARTIIASYTYELRQETHILEYVNVPRYDPKSPVHKQISQLSRRAHELAKCIYTEVKPDYCGEFRNPKEELAQVEEQIDRLVAELYGMPGDALQDIKRLLAILKAEEALEGGKVEEEALEPSIEFLKTDVAAGQRDYVEFNVVTVEECDKARITLQGPWGVKDLSLGEGRHKLEVILPEGVYEVKYTFICGEHSYEGSFKVTSSKSLPTGPKRPSTLKLG